MLSAFSYGYTVTMPFGGLIASRFGPHRVLFIGILIRGLVVTLTPGSALLSPYLLIAVEVVRGIVTASLYKEILFKDFSYSYNEIGNVNFMCAL